MSSADILATLRSLLGKDLENLSPSELAAVAAALSGFNRQGNVNAGVLARQTAELAKEKKNPYFYTQYKVKSPEYISLKTIADATSFRYIYDDTKKQATLTQGSKAYIFRTGDTSMSRGNGSETLKNKVVKSGVPYISEDDAKEYFVCTAEYIPDSSDAVCLTANIASLADDIEKALEGN